MPILSFAIAFLLFTIPAHAAFIQYKLDTKEVTAISNDTIAPVPNHGVVNDPRFTRENYPWPAPSGCAAGKLEWTKVVTVSPLALVVEDDVLLFRCRQVGSADDVEAIVAEEINASTQHQTAVEFDELISSLRILTRECPVTNTSQECTNKRTQANTALDAAKTRHEANDAIRRAADQFKQTQGW